MELTMIKYFIVEFEIIILHLWWMFSSTDTHLPCDSGFLYKNQTLIFCWLYLVLKMASGGTAARRRA